MNYLTSEDLFRLRHTANNVQILEIAKTSNFSRAKKYNLWNYRVDCFNMTAHNNKNIFDVLLSVQVVSPFLVIYHASRSSSERK